MAEERTSEPKGVSTETSQTEKQIEKGRKKMQTEYPRTVEQLYNVQPA